MATLSNTDPSSQLVIRWAIGSADAPRSSLWGLWGNKKGDFYASVRSLGGTTKAGFHHDGKCHVGFTQNYFAIAAQRFGVRRRHWEEWHLPADRVVRILQIAVPWTELRRFSDRKPPRATWLPPPPDGSVAVVSIFLS